ncbi:MAG TPA: asparagine synthase C-terminal domain-containing protein [Burkholderiaceae bacterium]|jgi:asparagine synthase (glutamine-hydrolysing)
MDTQATTLLIGDAIFTDPQLKAIAEAEGLEAAWRRALAADPATAASKLQGNFAVGLTLAGGATFLAVDRFAVQSMCYRVVDGQLRFAQRADELASGAELDPQAIFDYLYFHVIPSPRTIFKNVFRLPAGHYALFEHGELTVAPYWIADFSVARAAPFDSLRDEFQSILQTAVADQLDGGKAGCFLSGGTDSSTVAGMIGRATGHGAATYSIGFDAEGYDEMAFARIAAKHFKTEHHEYYVTPADLVNAIPMVATYYDQPFGNSSALPAFYCAKMAREDGVSKILAGDGGDELFGGNTRYAKQKVFGFYENVPESLRRSVLEPVSEQAWTGHVPVLRKAASYVRQARVPMPDRMQTYNLLEHLGLSTVLSERFLQSVDADAPHQQQREVWAQSKGAPLVDRMLAIDWRYTLAECDLPKVCGTTALAGVNVGFPMLDDRLLDFSLRLPVQYKVKGLKLRWFFKEALRGFLPDEIITKKKQGFGLPFGVWLTRDPALMRLAADSVSALAERGLVREEFARSLLNERLHEHPGYYGEMIWILTMLEQWLRKHAPSWKLQ